MQLVTRIVSKLTSRTLAPMLALSLGAIGCEIKEAEPQTCAVADDCDDGDDCTTDTCENLVCINTTLTTPECVVVSCVDDTDCDDDDECTADICGNDGFCTNEAIPDCGADGPLSGVADLYVADDGNAMLFSVYSTDPAYQTYLEDQEAEASIAIGTCAPFDYSSPGQVTLISMGDLVIRDGSTVIATVPPDANNRYDSYQTPFTVVLGELLDLFATGAAPEVTESLIVDAFEVPPPPTFTNLTFTDDTINGTFTYDPVPADRLYLHYQYFTTEPATVRCRLDPAAGTFTMDSTTYAGLGQSGTVRAEIKNVRRGAIHAADQDRALAISTTRSTANGNYTKAP